MTTTSQVPNTYRSSMPDGLGRIAITTLVLAGLVVFMAARGVANAATLLLLLLVGYAGHAFAARLSRSLADPRLVRLAMVHTIKLGVCIPLLYVAWTPQLDQSAIRFGYDPQRFYFEAFELANSGFDLSAVPSINFSGVLFYYGGIFRIFGHNPVAPLLVNFLLTLIVVVLLVRVGYAIKPARSRQDWRLCLLLVLPEVVWFDMITARDTIGMQLAAIAVLSMALALLRPTDRPARRLAAAMCSLTALSVIRLSTALAVAGVMIVLLAVERRRSGGGAQIRGFVSALALAFVLASAPGILRATGSVTASYTETLSRLSTDIAAESEFQFADRSLARALASDSLPAVVALAPVRAGAYVVAPLPSIRVEPGGLAGGSWAAWQGLATLSSSLLYLVLFPRVVASFLALRRTSFGPSRLVLHLPLVVLFTTLAVGNQIIQPRYRLMAVPFLIGCAWLGGKPQDEAKGRLLWFGAVSIAAIVFAGFKAGF